MGCIYHFTIVGGAFKILGQGFKILEWAFKILDEGFKIINWLFKIYVIISFKRIDI